MVARGGFEPSAGLCIASPDTDLRVSPVHCYEPAGITLPPGRSGFPTSLLLRKNVTEF